MRRRARRSLNLDELHDFEAVLAQQADPVAVRQAERDAVVVAAPVERVHPELRTKQRSSICPVSGMQRSDSVLLHRNTSRPFGRRRRAASGIHR
jgi:hypothetical protein